MVLSIKDLFNPNSGYSSRTKQADLIISENWSLLTLPSAFDDDLSSEYGRPEVLKLEAD